MGPPCTSHHCCCCCVTRGVFIQHGDRIVHGAERRLFGPLRLEHLDLHHVKLAPVRLLLLRTPTNALIFLSAATVPLTRPREANTSKALLAGALAVWAEFVVELGLRQGLSLGE